MSAPMSAASSRPPSPGESDTSPMASPSKPAEPLSSTSAAASGTLDSSAFQKERRSSVSMKRHHDDDVDYEKEDSGGAIGDADDEEDSNRMLRETRTTNTAAAAGVDSGDAVMTHSPVTKKKRISVQLPEQIRAQKQRDAAAAVAAAGGNGSASDMLPPKPERTSSTTTASPPTTPHTPIARRLSMTEDQKRASFTLTIARALQASYPLSPITNSTPTAVSPHIQSIATTLEQSLYNRHSGLTLDYTAHVRDIAFNLTHSIQLARRIVDGRVSIERVSGMNWKEFADGEVQRERKREERRRTWWHIWRPVDVTPGILPNAKTVER